MGRPALEVGTTPISGMPDARSSLESDERALHRALRAAESDREARSRLVTVLKSLKSGAGPFHFALLRESPLDEGLLDGGDADLFGSRESVSNLLRYLLQQATDGQVHFRVTSSKPEKLQLTIYSTDFTDRAVYDLWIELPQILGGRAQLRFEDVAPVLRRVSGIEALPECVAGPIYLHHLDAKHRSLAAPHTVERLRTLARHHCGDPRCGVAGWMQKAQEQKAVSPKTLSESADQLERLLSISLRDSQHRTPLRWRRPGVESTDAVFVLGVDGVGKSSLIEKLVEDGRAAAAALTGKKLYRRSLLYRLATRSARHRNPAGRESVDERLAPLLFLRAISAFRQTVAWRRLTGQGTLLVDRCPLDFLYCGRKTERGHFHAATRRLQSLAPAAPSIQLVAPHHVTSARKAELMESGHAAYDEDMLLAIAGTSPCDHLVFHNGGAIEQSSQTLSRYLLQDLKTIGVRRAA